MLYDRFNAELATLSRAAEAGAPEKALLERLRESQDELARVRRENARLRREAALVGRAAGGGAGTGGGRGKV